MHPSIHSFLLTFVETLRKIIAEDPTERHFQKHIKVDERANSVLACAQSITGSRSLDIHSHSKLRT